MDGPKPGHDIEIYYGLHGGAPVLIGGGSYEDAKAAFEEADRANAAATEMPPGRHASPGTRAFYTHLGATAGVSEVTDAALGHYDHMVEDAQQAARELLGSTGPGETRPKPPEPHEK